MRTFRLPQLALLGALWAVFAGAQGLNQTSNSTAAALFISPAADIAFALNVPNDSSADLYFSLTIPIRITWGAIGLGSNKMAGSLILLAYSSSSGKNVTLSPRIARGHSEPVYSPGIRIEALPGTGMVDDIKYVFNGRCSNCRSWDGGSVDVASKAQSFLYATGPDGDTNDDAFTAPLKIHYTYGTFTMDMVRATGSGGVPKISIGKGSVPIATTQGLSGEFSLKSPLGCVTDEDFPQQQLRDMQVLETDFKIKIFIQLEIIGKQDIAAMMHAIIMIFCFIGLFPFGILVLRLGNWVRWHGINQAFALVGVIVGASLGFHISGSYNRSKSFSHPHQIIGIIVFLFVIAQFILGFMHHRVFKKTQQPTKLAPVHVWLGRLTIVLGVINAFLGFPFALSSSRNYILAGLVIFIFPVLAIVLVTKKFIMRRWRQTKENAGDQGGYDLEPWRQGEAQGDLGHRATATAGQETQEVPMAGAPPGMGSHANYHGSSGRKTDLGPQQTAREYV